DRQVEEAADTGPYGLGIVGVDRPGRQQHRNGPERIRAPDQGAEIAGVPDLGGDHVDPLAGRQLVDGDQAVDRNDALRGDGVTERVDLVADHDGNIGTASRCEDRTVTLDRGRGADNEFAGGGTFPYGLRSVDQEGAGPF